MGRGKALGEGWNFEGQAVDAGNGSLWLRIGVYMGLPSVEGLCEGGEGDKAEGINYR